MCVNASVCVCGSDLKEGEGGLLLQEMVSVLRGPMQDQPDDPPLVIQAVVHPLLLRALRRLRMVAAGQLKGPNVRVADSFVGGSCVHVCVCVYREIGRAHV